jgi:hypothetical protein
VEGGSTDKKTHPASMLGKEIIRSSISSFSASPDRKSRGKSFELGFPLEIRIIHYTLSKRTLPRE